MSVNLVPKTTPGGSQHEGEERERQRLCERVGLMTMKESKSKREGYIEMETEREKKK